MASFIENKTAVNVRPSLSLHTSVRPMGMAAIVAAGLGGAVKSAPKGLI